MGITEYVHMSEGNLSGIGSDSLTSRLQRNSLQRNSCEDGGMAPAGVLGLKINVGCSVFRHTGSYFLAVVKFENTPHCLRQHIILCSGLGVLVLSEHMHFIYSLC